ncbi:hypothetical protein JWJ90_13225 [Desulfobulbus rhabdoformis]|uniref:hypothetical protein n=1 Tax=Desulfobulbus rhabdoformis TaxID=34032 RepID=UPI0019659C62|nr:hypothetical protein [Desulfobulbus rhabdoformis]MBM9615241.1 hypothetical protein [Desulfobulbus rhabdoformis]
MTKPTAKELAGGHWGYTEKVIKGMLDLTGTLFQEAMIHGIKHGQACDCQDDDPYYSEAQAIVPVDQKKIGMYKKYVVTRVDGQSAPGKKHHDCDFFVLDLTHDIHAIPAIRAYAESCKDEYPELANDLTSFADGSNGSMASEYSMAHQLKEAFLNHQLVESTKHGKGCLTIYKSTEGYEVYFGLFSRVYSLDGQGVADPEDWIVPVVEAAPESE